MRFLILAPFEPASLASLATLGEVAYEPWLESGRIWDPEELGRRLAKDAVDALVVEADFVLSETLALAPGLRFIGVCRGDVGAHVDLDAATARAIPVATTPGRNAVAVAELTVGLMLVLARGLIPASEAVRRGGWQTAIDGYTRWRGHELSGRTAGLVGLGAVGLQVARRLLAFDMRVLACDPSPWATDRATATGIRMVELPDLLAHSDFVSLHAPLTGATRGLIGARELNLMCRGAFLVNTARAALVEEPALLEALRGGHLAGAALDVHLVEPLPSASPWLSLENVILTPHIGGATEEVVRNHSRLLVAAIEDWLGGRRPQHLANPEAWCGG